MLDKRTMINNGKRIIFLGSSVTYGSAAGGISFADIICEKYGYEMIKEAVSGTTLIDENDESYVKRIRGIKADSADLFVCQLSTNDASHDSPLGNITERKNLDSFDLSTVAGAIEYIIAYARKEWKCPIAFYTGSRYDSEKYGNMVLLLKSIAQKWDIEIINLWDDPDFNSVNAEDYRLLTHHPSLKLLMNMKMLIDTKIIICLTILLNTRMIPRMQIAITQVLNALLQRQQPENYQKEIY